MIFCDHIEIEGKCGCTYWGVGGDKGNVAPPLSNYLGGCPPPPPPPPNLPTPMGSVPDPHSLKRKFQRSRVLRNILEFRLCRSVKPLHTAIIVIHTDKKTHWSVLTYIYYMCHAHSQRHTFVRTFRGRGGTRYK